MYLRHGRTGRILVWKILFASELTSRRGIMGQGDLRLADGVGIFAGSGSLASVPVQNPLDLVALDRDLKVVAVYPAILPAQAGRVRVEKLLGLSAGAAARADLRCGDTLELGLC
ncbi:MAG: uncharacterized protein PWP43_772 [Bacillota bacterium]|nr:uncharacterized protein [Bacillota bacterium]